MATDQTPASPPATPASGHALPPGTGLLSGEFKITSQLSAGGFGLTYLAQDTTLDREIVIKECFPEAFCERSGKTVQARNDANTDQYNAVVKMFMREARSVAAIRHANIVGVHRVFEENGTAYMALDRIQGQDLLDRIELGTTKLTPDEVETILLKLLDAIGRVHDHDTLHRDISPDNILLEPSGNPVLIDFGAARGEASRKTRAISSILVVKDGYSPQEFYMAGSNQGPYSDLYALGATFYHVISGKAPPISQERMAALAAQEADPCVPLAGRFPAYPLSFLKGIDAAMRVLPQKRLQSAQDWIHLIARERTVSTASAISRPVSKPVEVLDKSITRLIEETNAQVLKSTSQAQAVPKSEPKPVAAPKSRVVAPDWLDEFNAETKNGSARITSDVIYKPAPEASEPNWIERAVQKQSQGRQSKNAVSGDAGLSPPKDPLAVLANAPQEDDASHDTSALEQSINDGEEQRPKSKSAATGLVLILSALAIQLNAN